MLIAVLVVASCSGGGGASAPSSAQPTTQPSAPATLSSAPATQASSVPASSAPSSPQPAAGGGKFPANPCLLVTAEDVTAIYGGSVKGLGLDEHGSCPFEISGKAKAGESTAGEFAVTFGDEFSPYETAKMLFGSGVVKIDGLATEAYSFGGFIHAKVGTGDLVVGGVWVGTYDRDLLARETLEMAKLLLGRL
jgi:hypothetical protein